MLVYANHFTLQGSAASEAVFRAVGGWLKEQLGFGLHPAQLTQEGEFEETGGRASTRLRIHATAEENPHLYSWILKHADDAVVGRQWVTEIGVKINADVVEVSCVVKTEEVSTLVAESVFASQPRVVRYVANNIRVSESAQFARSVPGTTVKAVGDTRDSYRALLGDIERVDRSYPIILVSPTTDGRYLVNADQLQEIVFGLSQVVQVDIDYDSYEMVEVLSQPWSAWNGAVNILHTRTRSGFIRGRIFLSETIEEWGDRHHDRVVQLLAWVTSNTNLLRLRDGIHPEGVARLSIRRRLKAIHAKRAEMDAEELRTELERATQLQQEQAEWIEHVEDEYSQLKIELSEVNASVEDAMAIRDKKEPDYPRI